MRVALQATAPTLTTLVVNNSYPTFPPPSFPCTLPALKTLSLGDHRPFSFACFIALVDVPALTELSLLDTRDYGMIKTVYGSNQTNTIANVVRYIPLHQIHTLCLSHLIFRPSALPIGAVVTEDDCYDAPRGLFSRLRQLRRLTLVHPDLHTTRALDASLSAHPIPLLSHLALDCIDNRTLTRILDTLKRRVKHDPGIPAVRQLEELTVRLLEGQPNSGGPKVSTEIFADTVRYEEYVGMGWNHECPTEGESLEYLLQLF